MFYLVSCIKKYYCKRPYKNLQIVKNEADGRTATAIQLVISTIEKRRDLFADLLPKFQEHIDQVDLF